MSERELLLEALRQMREGDDIATADWLCANLEPGDATRKLSGSPYSIATIIWHTWFWLRAWNTWIKGDGDPFEGRDARFTWPEVPITDWPVIRDRLRDALAETERLAAITDLERVNGSGRTAAQNLLQIVIHTSYHYGQMALILQELGLWPEADGG